MRVMWPRGRGHEAAMKPVLPRLSAPFLSGWIMLRAMQ